jgi:HEPN domain-containing protein
MPSDAVLRAVRAWLTKAEGDLRNIDLVLPCDDAPLDTVCFHAQQAAEKYLKGLLTFYEIPFAKTHDLPELVLLLPATSSVPTAVDDLSDLADAAVASRYPDVEPLYDRACTEALVDKARTVKAAVVRELAQAGYVVAL